MTNLQKAIKYLAMAFAIFLAVSIIGGILSGFGFLAVLSGDGGVLEEMKAYSISSNITELDMEIEAAELKLVVGDKISVSSNIKNLTVKEKNGTLVIEENSRSFFGKGKVGSLILSVPADFQFQNVDIMTGAGKIAIENLRAKELSLELGAGKVDIENLEVQTKAEIEGGAGKITVEAGILHNLDMDIGAGEVDMAVLLIGKSKINCGVGNTGIILLGSKEDYRIHLNTGIGNATVDGKSMTDDSTYGTGNNSVEVDGGMGSIRIDFAS